MPSASSRAAYGTCGALDNASGVAVLLAVAEQLATRGVSLEIALLNGEDHWTAVGQQAYAAELDPGSVSLAINVDGAGYRSGPTSWVGFSLGTLESEMRAAFSRADWVEGPAWYSGDHSLFLNLGLPTVAITSSAYLSEPSGLPGAGEEEARSWVDPKRLADVVEAVCAALS